RGVWRRAGELRRQRRDALGRPGNRRRPLEWWRRSRRQYRRTASHPPTRRRGWSCAPRRTPYAGPAGVGDDGKVPAGFHHRGGSDLDAVITLGYLSLGVVQREVFQQDHGIIVADRGGEQALGVGWGGRSEHFEAGYVRVPDLQVLRVGGGQLLSATTWSADHQRHADLTAERRVHLRRMVDDLIDSQQAEVDGHDLHDRAQPEHGRADRGTHEPFLTDGGVADAAGTELGEQSCGDLVGAFENADLLTDEQHVLIAQQLCP